MKSEYNKNMVNNSNKGKKNDDNDYNKNLY